MDIIYTLAFCAAVIGVALVVFWCVRNDAPEPGRPTTGLFAMRDMETERATTDQDKRKAHRYGRKPSRPERNA